MAIQKMDIDLIRVGPAWISYKGVQLGSTQGGVILKNENTSHEVKADQTGEEILLEILLGGSWSAEVPLIEVNKGLSAALVPGAVGIEASSPYVATDASSAYAAGKITFDVAIAGIQIGDTVHYTSTGSVVGTVAYFDETAKEVYLMDGDETPDASPSASLYHIEAVKFHNATGANLLTLAGELQIVPKDPNDTDYYILPSAGLKFNIEMNFLNDAERKMTLMFVGYPDADKAIHSTYGTGLSAYIGDITNYEAL